MGTDRLDVRSADGTPLAVWVEGQGPPLVLVHGSMCDHTASDPLVAELRDTMTTFAMDRRGFGASGAALTGAVHHLVLYEPGSASPIPPARSRRSRPPWPPATPRRRCCWCWPGSSG